MELHKFLTQSFDSPKSALIAIVEHFTNNPDIYDPKTILNLDNWESCVIGLLNSGISWQDSEEHILTNFLGLDLNGDYQKYYGYFSRDQNQWSDDEWKYFRFFTYDVCGGCIDVTLENWIDRVKNVLNES